MYKFLSKKEYFSLMACEHPKVLDRFAGHVKHQQDLWVYDQIKNLRDAKIIECGGGNSRILPVLHASNERWNVDELLGNDGGPSAVEEAPDVISLHAKIGDFHSSLQADRFDCLFSVSVMEHIPNKALPNFFQDAFRVLKSGGRFVHSIDVYLATTRESTGDAQLDRYLEYAIERVDLYEKLATEAGFVFEQPPTIERPMVYTSAMTANGHFQAYLWNIHAPQLQSLREIAESCTLQMGMYKP